MDWTGGDAFASLMVALWSGFMCFAWIIPMVAAGFSIVAWIVAIVDVLQRDPADFPNARAGRADPNERLIWVVVIVLAGVFGAIVYYFIVMRPYPRRPAGPPAGSSAPPADLSGQDS